MGESVVFGFTAAENFVGFPELCELPVSKRTVPEGDYKVTCEVRDVWDAGYSGNLHILNSTEKTIEDWQLSFEMSCDIDDLWNGRIVSRESDRFLVKNNTYNQNIAPGEMLTIGFTVNDGSAEDLPHDFRLEELTWTGGYNTSGEDDSSAESGSNEGDGLTDLEELTQTGTDPLLTDSDDNGIWDGQEDLDGDGLGNLEELAAGTGIWYSDTDGDGLSDGEEVLQYHTDPLQADTDTGWGGYSARF